jgi:hypothetical protein
MNNNFFHKRNISIYLFIVVAGMFTGCFNSQSPKGDTVLTKKTDSLLTILNHSNNKHVQLAGVNNILIIPIDAGCESCIKKSLDFAMQKNDPAYLSIITSSTSKVFLQKLSLYFNNQMPETVTKNILVDSNNHCFLTGLSDIMPRLYQVKNEMITNNVSIDASNIDKELRK